MTSPERLLAPVVTAGAIALAAGLVLVGCSGDEAAAPVAKAPSAPPPPPPPPPKPAVTPVDQLMENLSIDERVMLPETEAPETTEDRVAVLEFFDAFVRGDTDSLGRMMSALDRSELDVVAETDTWEETISGISEVLLETGPGPTGEKCALAIFEVDGAFQPQLWYFDSRDGTYRFEAVASPPGVMDQLYGDDWIARWHELLEEELALANELEVNVEEEDEESTDRAGDSGGATGGPSIGTGGGGGRNPRRPPPRKPPSPNPFGPGR